jgi:hypothetical protein
VAFSYAIKEYFYSFDIKLQSKEVADMTIHFIIFTVRFSWRQKQNYQPLPGYRPSAQDQWLDRKALSKQII